jgi:hypothetical protein
VPFDVSSLAASVVSCEGNSYRCLLCNRVLRLSGLKYHLARRHCGELLELWVRFRPKARFRGGGGRVSFMPFVFYCRSCGWSIRLEFPCNAGPPNVRRKLEELLGSVIPRSCPRCGRLFDVSRVEFGFVGEKVGV